MASFLTDLVKPYVEKLINGVIVESSYICCFTCIAKDFEEEKSRLEIERATFERHIEEATRRGEDVLPDALAWKDEVDQLIQEDTKIKQKCFFEFCPHCLWRYSRGNYLVNKKERIKVLMEMGKELTVGVPAHLPDIERSTTQHYVHLKSRESQYTELLVELKDDNNYIIGLHGMGGTGKTTLIKKVGKELKHSKQFSLVIDTTVSFSPNIKMIQDDIAGPLGLKFDDCNDSDRPKKLWNRLTNGEKILLILDDVWGEVDFNEIGIPCSENHNGCRIIITTREWSVCDKLGCNKTIKLDLLSKEDAWIMFKKYADLRETSEKFFLDKGREIANECKNLPIAIAVIASSLKGKRHQEEWDMALKFLKKEISSHNDDDEVLKIYKCLKFSYDKLNEEDKRLFLLCSVFREDAKIHTEKLARLALGGGLFGENYHSYDEARSRVVKSKIKLLDSCLLLEVHQKFVKMHDFARDAAQWIAKKEIQTRKVYDKSQKAMLEREKNIKYLFCEGKPNEVFSCKFDGSKLEILIVFLYKTSDLHVGKIEVPDSFFENNTSLRVFDLLADTLWRVISLPQSMQRLKNIRSLIFKGWDLGDISIFGNLQSLEELDLHHCYINEMPNGITKLEKFRWLRLKECEIRRNNPFEVIERCTSLQELYFMDSFNQFCREITFPKLQRFHVVYRAYIPEVSPSKYVSLEHSNEVFLSETTLKYCMQEAEVLRLRRIEGEWRNIIPDIIHMDQGMNDLIEFRLCHISQLKCLSDTTKHTRSRVSNVFSKLVVLSLSNMENLEELCNGSLSVDSFKSLESLSIDNCKQLRSLSGIANQCNLKSVSVYGCPMLISLFEVSTSGSLVLLENLEVSDCKNLEYIITHERKGKGSTREIFDGNSRDPMFKKLKHLCIMRCPKFEIILPLISAHDLPALKSINVLVCVNLKYIFGQGVELGSLEDIKLDHVPNLIEIFRECLSRQSKIMCNVKNIELNNLKIKSLFALSITPKMLLETLRIENCHYLRHIIIDTGDHDSTGGNNFDDVFPKLKELHIVNCCELEFIFGHYTNDHQNHAEKHLHLSSLEHLRLYRLPSLVDICPKQYHATFPLLKELLLKDCLWAPNRKSIGDFILHHSRSVNCPTMKELSGSREDLLALEKVKLTDTNIETIFCVSEVNEQQVNLGLQNIKLKILNMMVCPFVGPKNSVSLLNLKKIIIIRCEKLQKIFSASILRCLPQLNELRINECEELKYIFEDDLENQNMSNSLSSTTCFPKLKVLAIHHCKKLKYVFPVSICNELPELKILYIKEAKELEEIFKSSEGEGVEKVRIPNLKLVAILGLPSLFQTQEILLQAVELHFIEDCDKLSLTSTSTRLEHVPLSDICVDLPDMYVIFKELVKASSRNELISQQRKIKQTQETDQKFVENVVGLVTPSVATLPTNSEGIEISVEEETTSANDKTITSSIHLELEDGEALKNEQSTIQQKSSQGNNGLTSEKIGATILSTISGTKNESPIQKDISVEGGTASSNAKTLTTSKHEKPSHEYGNGQTTRQSFSIFTKDPLAMEVVDHGGSQETNLDFKSREYLDYPLRDLSETLTHYEASPSQNESTSAEIEVKAASTDEFTSPQGIEISVEEETASTNANTIASSTLLKLELINEQLRTQQSLGKSHATIKPSQENKGSLSEKIAATTLSIISETKNESPIQLASPKQKTSVEERTASSNANTLTSTSKSEEPSHVSVDQETTSTNSRAITSCPIVTSEDSSSSQQEYGNGQTNIQSFPISTKEPLAMEVVDHGGSLETNQIKNLGDTSQIVEGLSSSLLVQKELEQLVLEKHLDYKTLSLLTDFLVKHPSVLLNDALLTNRFKGYAYICLADLLKFLQTHSVLDVLGSSHSEFVGLVQVLRNFPFNKDWLDGVEKRALFPDLQFSHDAIQKLLDSKKQVIKEIEDIKHQLKSSEAALASIIQQEEHVLKTTAALSVPLGY